MSTVRIDGSYGEGGGQVLRTSLAMAALTGRPVQVRRIRAGRPKPGLAAQHLTACRAAVAITGGRLTGGALGSQELRFEPGPIRAGEYEFDVGTAGATTLVFQAVLPALASAAVASGLTIRGGTHVNWSPPFEYVRDVFLPALGRMGLRAEVALDRPGWYPRGGGVMRARVEPATDLQPLCWPERGELRRLRCVSGSSGLPEHVTHRQLDTAVGILRGAGLEPQVELWQAPARDRGSFCLVQGEFASGLAGCSALGARGKRAEEVGAEAAEAFLAFLGSAGAADARLADQLVPYLALAKGESRVAVETVSPHLLTNAWVVQQFTERAVRVVGQAGGAGRVIVGSDV